MVSPLRTKDTCMWAEEGWRVSFMSIAFRYLTATCMLFQENLSFWKSNQFKTIFICFKHLFRGGIEVLRNKWNLGVSWLPSEGERGGERGQFFPEREFSPGSIALQQRTADVSPTIHYYQSRSPIFSLRLFEAISEYLNFSILSNI